MSSLPPAFSFLVVVVVLATTQEMASAKTLRPLRPLQEKLVRLTRPAVCLTRRAAKVAMLQKELGSPACKAFPHSATCATLRSSLLSEKNRGCGAPPSPARVNAALRRLERTANAHTRANGLRPSFPTLVLEPAGVVPHVTLVVLHGFGGDRDRLAASVRLALQTGALRAARVLLPLAPVRTDARGTFPSWFDAAKVTPTGRQWNRVQLEEAAANVSRLLDIDARLFKTDRWLGAVGGFSQGGALALTTYLRHRVSAVGSLAGFLPDAGAYPTKGDRLSKKSPAILVHGDADEIVPIDSGRASAARVAQLGRETRFVELKGAPHDFGGSISEAVEVSFSGISDKMFPGWSGREVAPPPLEWNLEL